MKSHPIRYCTGGCKTEHSSHLYSVDPVDGPLHSVHICPGNSGAPVMEELEDGEPTGYGHFAEEATA